MFVYTNKLQKLKFDDLNSLSNHWFVSLRFFLYFRVEITLIEILKYVFSSKSTILD